MTLPYSRKFNVGRGSDQLFNEEMHQIIESIRHLLELPEGDAAAPHAKLHGSLWLDQLKNELNYYDKNQDKFVNIFEGKFKIIDQLMNHLAPDDPVLGQLWINNGVLMYFDGAKWAPIKALLEDGSQFNLSSFEDFLVISPLHPSGNFVVDDAYNRAVLGGKLDLAANSQFFETDEKFGPNWVCPVNAKEYHESVVPPDVMSQFLLPNEGVDRFYIDGKYEPNYEKINSVTIQYPTAALIAKTPSLVHVNPGKVTSIKKRLVKINKLNPRIHISAYHTEFYGFRRDRRYGTFLRPSEVQDDGDYIVVQDAINLNYDAAQNYDYLLAITYNFSWIKSSGRLTKSSSKDVTTSYFVNGGGPLNVFVEGYDLEDQCFDYDNTAQVVNINEETRGLEVSLLRSANREYGYIRETDLQGRGIIKTLGRYKTPLVFVNGEAIHPSLGDMEIDGDKIFVQGARRNMTWCVMELNDALRRHDMFYQAGLVSETANGVPSIRFDNQVIQSDEGMVLFVDGLLIKKEHLTRDQTGGWLTTENLALGQEYILLKDKYHNLYDEDALVPALKTGRLDESLVFFNGALLCNDTAFVTTNTKDDEQLTAAEGELKLFAASEIDRRKGEWCVYDSYRKAWLPMQQQDKDGLLYMACTYDNTVSAIKLNIPYDGTKDIFHVFAYAFANTIDKPLIIRSFYTENEKDFAIENTYLPDTGALSVWVNGVRQYRITEYMEGNGFSLSAPVTGRITYIIENPERGALRACVREILTPENAVEGAINAYRTQEPLYPGRVTVYVSGLRMPKEAWTILDNHTILLKDTSTVLLGNTSNWPMQIILRPDGTRIEAPVKVADEVLIEVRQEFSRVEQTIVWREQNEWDIEVGKYDLPKEILEASDEILIFFNGMFTGLRCNFGYKKDKSRGCITFLSSSAVEAICNDPLYNYLMQNQDKRLAYKNEYGHDYVAKVENRITLEWR